LTILPWLACKTDVLAKRVVAVPIDDAMLSASSVDICVREERVLPPAVKEFLEEITFGDGFNPPEMKLREKDVRKDVSYSRQQRPKKTSKRASAR
jgi:hypothetical protein